MFALNQHPSSSTCLPTICLPYSLILFYLVRLPPLHCPHCGHLAPQNSIAFSFLSNLENDVIPYWVVRRVSIECFGYSFGFFSKSFSFYDLNRTPYWRDCFSSGLLYNSVKNQYFITHNHLNFEFFLASVFSFSII